MDWLACGCLFVNNNPSGVEVNLAIYGRRSFRYFLGSFDSGDARRECAQRSITGSRVIGAVGGDLLWPVGAGQQFYFLNVMKFIPRLESAISGDEQAEMIDLEEQSVCGSVAGVAEARVSRCTSSWWPQPAKAHNQVAEMSAHRIDKSS